MSAEKDTERFTIKDEEDSAEALYIADAENLRIEKLSTKVTMITILIPFLLVIILAVAYLDIKNRVISTQNTGSMGVQNLSKDLESRFSSLSLKQAKLEAQFAEQAKILENSAAAIQVNLKKTTARFEQITDKKADRSELTALSDNKKKTDLEIKKDIERLHKQMKELNAAFTDFDAQLASQILLMAEGFKKSQGRISKVENRTQKLETEKLSKEAMNLSLGLERLALQEMVKDRIREVDRKLTGMDRQIKALSRKLDDRAEKKSQGTQTPAPTQPTPQQESKPSASSIEEQTIQ
jgi:chromosome segregation ATPase